MNDAVIKLRRPKHSRVLFEKNVLWDTTKGILMTFLLVIFCSNVFGQGEANVWYFGSKGGLTFPNGGAAVPRTSSSVGGTDIMESASSISDAAGNFLFGTNGSNIFSADLVTRGTLPNGSNEQQAQGAMIIPAPGVSGLYFLSTVVSTCNNKPAYTNITVTGTTGNNITIGSKVDLVGGITQGQMVLPKTDASGNLTDEFWLVHHQIGTDKFNVYSVTSTGINPTPIVKTAGPVMSGSCGDNTAYFKANACYDQFAYSYGSDVYLFDFDTRTADITYRNSKNIPSAYGIEFSKNGKYVYVSTGTINGVTPEVYKIDVIPGGAGSTLQGTPTQVMTLAQTSRGGCLQMGPDGKIYCASFSFSGTGPYLGVISNPENATGFNNKGVNLGSGVSIGMGLPAFITSLVSSVVDLKLGGVSASSTSLCNNTAAILSAELNKNAATSANWEITSPSGGVTNYTNQNNFSHTFSGVGVHTVKITLKDNCGRDKISTVEVKVEDIQTADASEDACVAGKRLLQGSGSASGNYKWYTGNPASGGVLLSIGATYQATAGSQIWVEPAGTTSPSNITINDNRTTSRSQNTAGNTTITIGSGTSSINSFQIGYFHDYNGSPTPGSITFELRDGSNNVVGTSITRSIPNTGQYIGITTMTINPTDWNNLSSGTYTVVVTKTLPSAIKLGTLSSNSYSSNGFVISDGVTFKYNITNSSNTETSTVTCKVGKLINVSNCCSQPTPTLSLSATSICEGGTITLTASTTATGTIVYEFSKGSSVLGTTTSPTNTYTINNVTATNSGSYTVKVLSSGTCGTASVASTSVTLTVNSKPAAPTVITPVNLCANATASALSATALSGHTLQWYGTDATGGTASTTAPTPVTTSTGTVKYYVSQKNTTTGCESPRAEITVTVNGNPSLPTVTSAVSYCKDAAASALSATALSGHTLQWYGTSATGGTASTTAPTPLTSTVGTAKYYVSQKNTTTGCEGPRAEITVTINDNPAVPTVTTPLSYCINTTASALSATALSGHTLQWYGTNSSGGTASATAPTPTTTSNGTTKYYVSQKNTTTGCESARAEIAVDVTNNPALPVVTTPVNLCENGTATALSATALSGHALQWYGNDATGGTASTTAPTPVTTTTGSVKYYVSQKNISGGCESGRAEITVTVNANPSLPSVTSAVSYCKDATASALNATATSGHTLQWYGTDATGGTASTTAPTPVTTTSGTVKYYVSQKNTTTGCESPRAEITVTVNNNPAAPTVTTPVNLCESATAAALNATALTDHTLQWYGTNASGGTAGTTAPTPSTSTSGTVKYYVSQKDNGSGCESPRAEIVVNVNPLPTATISAATTSICPGNTATLNVQVSGGTGPWTVTYTVNSTNQTLTVPTSGSAQITASVAGDYEIVSVENTTTNCSKAITGQKVTVTVLEDIDATAVTECRDKQTHYQLKVVVSKGSIANANNFKVTNASGGSVIAVTWTETPVGSGVWVSGDIDETITTNLEITNSNGCLGKTFSNLKTQCSCPAVAAISFSGASSVCFGQTSTIDVAYSGGTGNYDIELLQPDGTKQTKNSLSGSSTSFTVSQKGNYSAIVTSLAENCSSTSGLLNFVIHDLPTVVANASSTSICEGEKVTLTGSGASTYTWNNGATNGNTLVLTSTTTFTVTGKDVNGCENTNTITINVNPAPQPRTVADAKACLGTDAYLIVPNAQSGVKYQINGAGQEYSGSGDLTITIDKASLQAGTNTFTITGMATGCGAPVVLDNAVVMVLGKASESLDENLKWTNKACEGKAFGIVDMSSTGVNGYDWQVSPAPAALVKNGLTSTLQFNGVSSVTLTAIPSIDGFTCATSNLTKTITLIPAYIPEVLVASEDTICAGDTITFTVISANQGNTTGYTWQYVANLGIEEMKNMHSGDDSHVYRFNQSGISTDLVISVIPQHACGIQNAISNGVTVIDIPHANAGGDDYLNNYATIDLKGDESTPLNQNLYTYTWSSPDPKAGIVDPSSISTTGIPASRNTQYIFRVESKNDRSCASTSVKNVVIDIKLQTPNVFTPNGDGIHDTFVLENIELFPKAVIYIYNQWGELVFKSEVGYPSPWDGRRDGKACTVGTYYYVLELHEEGYKPITGAVSIVR